MSQNDGFDPQLEKLLEQLQETPERDPQRASRGRAIFLTQVAAIRSTVSNSLIARLIEQINKILRKEKFSMVSVLTSIIVVFTLIFGGAGITVYAAQDSLPDEALYSVKTFTEDIQVRLTSDRQARYALQEKLVQRRFTELYTLLKTNQPVPSELATRMEQQLWELLNLAASMEDPELKESLQHLRIILRDQDRLMGMYGEQIPENANPVFAQIRQTVEACNRIADSGLEDPLQFRLNMQLRFNKGEDETSVDEGSTTPQGTATPQGTGTPTLNGTDPDPSPGPNSGSPQPEHTTTPAHDGYGPGTGNPSYTPTQAGNGTDPGLGVGTPIATPKSESDNGKGGGKP
jgi:hypothetical protein